MSANQFFLEIISPYTRIHLSRPGLQLAQEISRQLSKYDHVKLEKTLEKTDVLIHFAGFEKDSFAETLQHTTQLHQLMDQALIQKAKFILVMPEPVNSMKETAITLVKHFGRNFHLNHRIILTDPRRDPKSTAEEIIRTFVHRHQATDPILLPIEKKLPSRKKTQSSKKTLNIVGITLLFLIAYLVTFFFTGWSLSCALNNLKKGNLSRAVNCAQVAEVLSRATDPTGHWKLSQSSQLVGQLSRWSKTGFDIISGSSNSSLVEWSQQGIKLADQVAYLQPQLSKLPVQWIEARELAQAKYLLTKLNMMSDVLKEVMASQQTNILVLLQDDTELRPTGGFLSDIAIAKVGHGKFLEVNVYSVQDLDSQLRGQVEPPVDFATVTDQRQWYLRDSNWEIDFNDSAERADWFVEKELGQKADWVIGTNITFLEMLLEIAEGVMVDDQLITAETLRERHVELSRPDANPTFINKVATQLFEQWPNFSLSQKQMVFVGLLKLLETRQVTISKTAESSQPLAVASWDGGVKRGPCDCIDDMFYAVDANIGANRANHFLKTKQKIITNFSASQRTVDWQIDYQNSSSAVSWPEGIYKSYLRLVYPREYVVEKLSVDGRELGDGDYFMDYQNGLAVLGTVFEVKTRASAVVRLELKQSTGVQNRIKYRVSLPNQPGRNNLETGLYLNFPRLWKAEFVTPNLVASEAGFKYNTVSNAPLIFDLELTPTKNGN